MPRVCYTSKEFSSEHAAIIDAANLIIEEYVEQGFRLTLRQLYYQFVARDLVANTVQSYKRLGGIISDARLAGLIDWDAIEDRTRSLRSLSHWSSPADIVSASAKQYRIDKWAPEYQKYRIEVWIEKEALSGVIQPTCQRLDVPYFSCRGYVSQSELWAASQRHLDYLSEGQKVLVIHLGDHDPSGIDMTRDISDRLYIFEAEDVIVKRIALNFEQVEEYQPPPNPAKSTDARFRGYVRRFGHSSWELDALEPRIMATLIESTVRQYRDERGWRRATDKEDEDRAHLLAICDGL